MKRSLLLLFLVCCLAACSGSGTDRMYSGFSAVPDGSRTKLWWFHGDVPTTREGITADLEAFKRQGIGGVIYYDQIHGDGRDALDAFSPEWWEMFKFCATEARRLGLTFDITVSNGFVAGGPWITPHFAMQRVTATDTLLQGGTLFDARVPVPADTIVESIATLAFPVARENWEKPIRIPGEFHAPADKRETIIPIRLDRPVTARSFTYQITKRGKSRMGAMNRPGDPSDKFYASDFTAYPDPGELETSQDGFHFVPVCTLKPIYTMAKTRWDTKTVSFPATTARWWRVRLHGWQVSEQETNPLTIKNLSLSSRPVTDQWEERAAVVSEYTFENPSRTPAYTGDEILDRSQMINLTEQVDANGHLRWQAPEGSDWILMHFVSSPTGGPQTHGRPNLAGPECDKMSVAAAELQFSQYAARMIDTLAMLGIRPDGLLMDSHEAGSQNWTPGFRDIFLEHKGYDLTPFLPSMVGYIVDSVEGTDRFHADLRRTIADCVSDNYFGTFRRLSEERGIPLTAQAAGNGQNLVSDNIQAKGRASIPQGEFWARHLHGAYDIKEASSAAHLYGQQLASCEAFTDANYTQSFGYLKQLADYAFAFQTNELAVCATPYQPWPERHAPGNTAGGRTYSLTSKSTWWEYSRPFWDYQARCAWMMRQGEPVVDLCIYMGEDAPVKLTGHRLPAIPEGYDFDVCTFDALMTRLEARKGRLVTPDGMSWRMLVIERTADVSETAQRKIDTLAAQGVPVYDARERGDRGLSEALSEAGIAPDLRSSKGTDPHDRLWVAHRQVSTADIYLVNNHSPKPFSEEVVLRTPYAYAEYWAPEDGSRYSLPSHREEDGLHVAISLVPTQTGFLVASAKASRATLRPDPNMGTAIPLEGPWALQFDPHRGGPAETLTLDVLTDWSQSEDPRIRYYSGRAIYGKTLVLPTPEAGKRLILSLPEQVGLSVVRVDGQTVKTVWCAPWEVDLTEYAGEGEHRLEIEAVNSLLNRMVGDTFLPEEERYTWWTVPIVNQTTPLVPSGLAGEVKLIIR